MADDFISASEIAEYVYCHRAWWYRLRGAVRDAQPALDQGIEAHEEFAEDVTAIEQRRRFGRRLLWIGLALLVVLVLLRMASGAA